MLEELNHLQMLYLGLLCQEWRVVFLRVISPVFQEVDQRIDSIESVLELNPVVYQRGVFSIYLSVYYHRYL